MNIKRFLNSRAFKIGKDIISSVNIPVVSAITRNISEDTTDNPKGRLNYIKALGSIIFGLVALYLIANGLVNLDQVKVIIRELNLN